MGTHQDNMNDMKAKRRAAISLGAAKLNWAAVDDIRSSVEDGKVMAEKHGVSKATISEYVTCDYV